MSAVAGVAAPLRQAGTTLRRRALPAGLLLLALVATYFLWFRDSSLVAVRTVHIEGLPPGHERLRDSLSEAAREMTTLHVRASELEAAAASFPEVAGVGADADFPRTLTVTVRLRPPVAMVDDGTREVPVAADGTLLPGVEAGSGLPSLPLATIPRSGHLDGLHLEEAIVLGAAPKEMRPHLEGAFAGSQGVGVTLEGGVELRFGTASHVGRKWQAAVAVTRDPQLGLLDYVDLRAPGRPSVGGGSHAVPAGLGA
jgi:hypothetical protein